MLKYLNRKYEMQRMTGYELPLISKISLLWQLADNAYKSNTIEYLSLLNHETDHSKQWHNLHN